MQAGYHRIEVEGDSQIVIKAIQAQISPTWQIGPILEDIRNMIVGCKFISFNNIYREGNIAADLMTKFRRSLIACTLSFFLPTLSVISFILVYDNLGKTFARRVT